MKYLAVKFIFFLNFATMRVLFVLIFLFVFHYLPSQNESPQLTWNAYVYYIPASDKCYVEISLSISPYNLNVQKKDSSYYVAVSGKIDIIQENTSVKVDSFIVKSPKGKTFKDIPYFGYVKRYWLENNKSYTISLRVKDYFGKDTVSIFKSTKPIHLNFSRNILSFSSIQFIDILEKSTQQNMFYKHGYTIVPYNDNYFDESFDQIKFFFEIYNADSVLGKEEPFLITYNIVDKDNNKVLENFAGFKKMSASDVNVFIGNLHIKNLPSGNYYLAVELKNKNNELLSKEQVYFQRKNANASKSKILEDLFFGNQHNIDTLKMWLECLWPIANNLEKEWIINQSISKDEKSMKNFMIDFWEKRAADTADVLKIAKAYYSKLNYVMKNFKCGKIAPYYTDRGRVYMQYGEPNQRVIQLSEPGAYPYEIWQYYRIYDGATNQFFSNKKFVFVNKGIADGCYTLIHSDMKGEYNNPNWQREIMKHEGYDINNPYKQQQINYGNNFDKLYQNPQ